MPRIDTYQANNSIAPVEIVKQDEGLYTHGGKAFSEVATQLNDVTNKFREIRNVNETTKASTDLTIALDKINNEASQDPNFNNPEAYRAKIDKVMGETLNTISEPAVRAKTEETFKLHAYKTYDNIQTNFNKRTIEQGQYNLLKSVDTLKSSYLSSNDPVEQQLQKDTALAQIESGVNSGLISSETGTRVRHYIDTKWDAMKQRNIDFANKTKARQDKEALLAAQENLINNESQLVSELAKGNLDSVSPATVSDMIANKEIRPEFGEAWLGYITDPTVVEPPLKKDPGFVAHVQTILTATNKNDVNLALLEVLKRKDVKKSEIGMLISLASERSKGLNGITSDSGYALGTEHVKVEAAISNLVNFSSSINSQDNSRVVKEFMMILSNEKDVAVAYEKAKIREALFQYPSIAVLKGTPNAVAVSGKVTTLTNKNSSLKGEPANLSNKAISKPTTIEEIDFDAL